MLPDWPSLLLKVQKDYMDSKVNIAYCSFFVMKVLLDSSFIISCVRKKIDFLVQLSEQGFKVLLPHEVFEELKDLRKKSSLSHEDRIAIDVAMEIFEKRKVKMMRLGSG